MGRFCSGLGIWLVGPVVTALQIECFELFGVLGVGFEAVASGIEDELGMYFEAEFEVFQCLIFVDDAILIIPPFFNLNATSFFIDTDVATAFVVFVVMPFTPASFNSVVFQH